jgi:TRAP-type mannitol/chloroaromatic compound transport system substrate-binding protein
MNGARFVPALVAAGAVGLAGGAATQAQEQETFQLTVQSAYPSGAPQYQGYERWIEQVERLTGGRVQIEFMPAGSVVPAFEVLDAVSEGIIDGGHAWSGFWVGKDRAAVMVSSGPGGPFGMDWSDYWGWIWEGGGLEVNNWFFQEHLGMNVQWFPAQSDGAQSLGWFNRELTSAEDLRGLTLRIPGIPGEMYQHMGVTVVTLPPGEVLAAGDRGVIDAAELAGPYVDIAFGLHDVWTYHYAPAYHEIVTVQEFLINRDIWSDLPDDIQAIIEHTLREHHLWWEQHKQYNQRVAMDQMAELGVEFHRTPDDILEESLEAWHQIFEEEYEANEAFRRIVNSQLEWASHTVVAKRIIEPDYKAITDIYWAPGGFLDEADYVEFEWEAPEYYERFAE